MKNIIRYQTLDLELEKLIRQQNSMEELKVIDRMKNIVKNAQNNSIKLEAEAENYLNEYNKLKQSYDKQCKKINSLVNLEMSKMSKDEVNQYLMDVNSVSSELFMIERNLNIVINNISKALRDFENNKKTAIMARTKHKEAKDGYSKKVNSIEPKIKKIVEELKSLEGGVAPELLAKYKTYKNDGIFPVFALLQNNACGYCRMEIPKSKVDNLKKDNFIICEHCRRIIYSE